MRRTDAAESGRDYRLGYTIGSRDAGNVQLSVGVGRIPLRQDRRRRHRRPRQDTALNWFATFWFSGHTGGMKRDIELEATLVAKFAVVGPVLDERSRRRWAAAESLAIGYGGDAVVSSATGLARATIRKGRREIARDEAPTDRIRRPGGGRPRIQQDQPGIQAALETLVDPLTRGDPTSPLRWTCKSRAKLAAALTEQGWRVSSTTVGRLLHRLGYRLQSPRKRQEGTTHPDRNAQFEHINRTADEHLTAGEPVISVDTKKKELVGNFKNGGREWQPKGTPPAVLVHDFPTDAEGKAIPYGVYDMARNEAWVSVGWDHDTPAFAVASIRQWWRQMGCDAYPDATTLFITADAGGSNGYRLHAWKHELQQLADETGLTIEVRRPSVRGRRSRRATRRPRRSASSLSLNAAPAAFEPIGAE